VADDPAADRSALSCLLAEAPRMNENLDGMSSEQLMLRDFLYEVPDLLAEADKECPDHRAGVFSALTMLDSYMKSFEIDQSRFARQMPNLDAWFLGPSK
jgi:hypothetical protein